MYLAELHGKLSKNIENKEDILTSNVFSFFKYANRDIFLKKFLYELGIKIPGQKAKEAEFIFWPKFKDGTEPDLVIKVGRYYLLFEAKYFSDFGGKIQFLKEQLKRELEGGKFEAKNLGYEFKLIIITADYYYKENKFRDISKEFKTEFIWINWQKIALIISDILESNINLNLETRLMAQDFYDLLIRKNLRTFQGLSSFSLIKTLKEISDDLFFESKTADYRGQFIGFINALTLPEKISIVPNQVFYSLRVSLFQDFPNRGLNNINKEIFFQKEGKDGK